MCSGRYISRSSDWTITPVKAFDLQDSYHRMVKGSLLVLRDDRGLEVNKNNIQNTQFIIKLEESIHFCKRTFVIHKE